MVSGRETMLAMWLACFSQVDIAEIVGVTSETVSAFLQKIQKTEELPKSEIAAIQHESDFDHQQVYSVWSFGKAKNEVRHFGNIPPEIIDNLCYYYTKPFDVVFDPFGGGGRTINTANIGKAKPEPEAVAVEDEPAAVDGGAGGGVGLWHFGWLNTG